MFIEMTAAPYKNRNSRVELLKVAGILLVVLNHVVQSLQTPSPFIPDDSYLVHFGEATNDYHLLLLSIFRYSGNLGNTLFFVCSAYYLLDSRNINYRKWFQLLVNIWAVSTIVLFVISVFSHVYLNREVILHQLFPTLFGNNWYMTCYLLFYLLHTSLNKIIHQVSQHELLRMTLVLALLYIIINFFFYGQFFFTSVLIEWIAIYFCVAYIKLYTHSLSSNLRLNVLLVFIGLVGGTVLILLTNYIGINTKLFSHSNSLLRWNSMTNPFTLTFVIGLLHIALLKKGSNRGINFISSFSMLIYIIHENDLLRSIYRPRLWQSIYHQFGYHYILVWVIILTLIVFLFGLLASILYHYSIQRGVNKICDESFPFFAKTVKSIKKRIMKLS